MRKKVLIITYYWPPAGGPGVQRVLKFVKYLPKFGWQPIVLTVENGEFNVLDESLNSEIPKECIVYKTQIKEFYQFYRLLTFKNKDEKVPTNLEKRGLFESIAVFIRKNFILPDGRVRWIKTIVNEGTKIVKKHRPDIIFASSPPHSVQIGAVKLAQKTGLHLVSDYRDPWMEIVYYQNVKRSFIAELIDKNLERKTMSSAHHLITISKNLKELLESKVDKEISVIPNGFDKDDFKEIKTTPPDVFTICYTGVITPDRIPHLCFQVLNQLKQNNEITEFKMKFVGQVCDEFMKVATEYNLIEHIEIYDYVPHRKAIQHLLNSSVCLLIIDNVPNNKGFLTGKIFDYLGCMRPIFGIGPTDGDASKILEETSSGKMIHYNDLLSGYDFMSDLYHAWKNKKDLFKFKSDEYDRKYQAKKLAEILNKRSY